MSEVRITAAVREEFGKGPARRTRQAGRVPAVIYGHGRPTRHVSLPGHELMLALKGGVNTLLEVELGDQTELALPRQVVRDPIKGHLEHLDLLVVRRGEKVSVSVPVVVVGEPVPDTLVDLQMTSLPVEAQATAIPGELQVSVEGLTPGTAITAAQITLPASVTLTGDPEAVVVHLFAAPTAEQVAEDTAGPVSAPDTVEAPVLVDADSESAEADSEAESS